MISPSSRPSSSTSRRSFLPSITISSKTLPSSAESRLHNRPASGSSRPSSSSFLDAASVQGSRKVRSKARSFPSPNSKFSASIAQSTFYDLCVSAQWTDAQQRIHFLPRLVTLSSDISTPSYPFHELFYQDSESGNTALHWAVCKGAPYTLVRSIIDACALHPAGLQILSFNNKCGQTVLHWSATNSSMDILSLLLTNLAPLLQQDMYKLIPLDHARNYAQESNRHAQIVKVFRNATLLLSNMKRRCIMRTVLLSMHRVTSSRVDTVLTLSDSTSFFIRVCNDPRTDVLLRDIVEFIHVDWYTDFQL